MNDKNLDTHGMDREMELFADYPIGVNPQNANFMIEQNFLRLFESVLRAEKLAVGRAILNQLSPHDASQNAQSKACQPKPAVWIPPGKSVSIHGFVIVEGMLYVGDYLKVHSRYGEEDTALVNPRLCVDQRFDCGQASLADSWVSYKTISPQARYRYLQWLSTGKQDPAIHQNYVLMYFYGLERRLLHDMAGDPAMATESLAIETEIERLIGVYQSHSFFYSHAVQLLSYIRNDVYQKLPLYYTQPAPVTAPPYHDGLTKELSLGIAQVSRDHVPLPADWALHWYLSAVNPPFYVRTAAVRCLTEFKQLFMEEYTNAFGAGLILKPNKRKLTLTYYPANRSLCFLQCEKDSDLPDISKVRVPLKKMAPLVERCHIRLDRYSRFIGRFPDKKGNMDALLELPFSLWPSPVRQSLWDLRQTIHAADAPQLRGFEPWIRKLPAWENQSKTKMSAFLNLLEQEYRLGVEPDCRHGGKIPKGTGKIALFSLTEHIAAEEFLTPSAVLAVLIVKLSLFMVQKNDAVPQQELILLFHQIDTWDWIRPSMQMRIKAQALWLTTQTIKTTGLSQPLKNLTLPQRELLARSMVQMAQADGKMRVAAIKKLEHIFKLLDMDSAVLYNTMHQNCTLPIHLSAIQQVAKSAADLPPIKSSIDPDKVARLQADSAKVTSLLDAIFAGADTAVQPIAPSLPLDSLWGLSAALTDFVLCLSQKAKWKKCALAQLAAQRGLMLEGAMEEINDAAFDRFDEALIEDDADAIEVNQEIVKVIHQ